MLKKYYTVLMIGLLLCLAILFLFYGSFIPKEYYKYDEADYMWAVDQGWFANWIDKNAIPIHTFLSMGINKGFEEKDQTSLSEYIRDQKDITFFRHYHGPLYFYLIRLAAWDDPNKEFNTRFASSIFWLLSIVVAFWSCYNLVNRWKPLTALLASGLLLVSVPNIQAAAQVTPHGLYVLLVLVCLTSLSLYIQKKQIRWLTISTFSLALAFLTIEYALLLGFTFILVILIHYRQHLGSILKRTGLIFGACFVVLWPAGIFKLTIIKNYLFFTYFTLVRGGEFYTLSVSELWLQRFSDHPLLYGCALIGLFAAILRLKKHPWYSPLIIYSGFLLLSGLRNTSPSPTYIASFLPVGYLLFALTLNDMASLQHKARIVSGLLILFFIAILLSGRHALLNTQPSHNRLRTVVEKIRGNIEFDQVLVDKRLIPTLEYYLPNREFQSILPSKVNRKKMDDILTTNRFEGILWSGSQKVIQETRFSYIPDIWVSDSKGKIVYYQFTQNQNK